MKRVAIKLIAIVLLLIGRNIAIAQDVSMDHEAQVILSTLQRFDDTYICDVNLTLPMIRAKVDGYLRKQAQPPNDVEIAKAVYTLFPCPFSPFADYAAQHYRPALAKDIEGAWLYPEASQKLRFGPKSPSWSRVKALPIKCEGVAYHPDGVVLHAQIVGKMACPFASAADIEKAFGSSPKVESWTMIADGRFKISRTDIPDHLEEWDIFIITSPHERYGVQFNTGDLVAYLRREKGNDYNVATLFWHLQRLPQI